MAVIPANLIEIKVTYKHGDQPQLGSDTNGGKLHTKSAVQRALGAEAIICYKCSSSTSVN